MRVATREETNNAELGQCDYSEGARPGDRNLLTCGSQIVMRTIESRINHARLGLLCIVIGAVGLVLAAAGSKFVAGVTFPYRLFLFCLLGDVYGICFFLWLLKRLKKQQAEKQNADLWKSH